MDVKESEKLYKYLDLAKVLKNLWDMKVTVKPIIFRAFGTVPKDVEKRLGELEIKRRLETI